MPPGPLTDHDLQSLELIKEMTTNLLYLGVGVFALVGGLLTTNRRELAGKGVLLSALVLFGFSLLAGLVLFMTLTGQLVENRFDPRSGLLMAASTLQILLIVIGCVLFGVFLTANFWERKERNK